MSFRFGADSTGNSRVTRTGGAIDPQAAGGFTFCGWFYLAVDRNDFSSLFRVHGNSGGSTRLNVATASDGTSPRIFTPGNTSGVAGVDAFTVGAWLWVAVTQSGTTATIYTCTPGGTMHSASGTSSGGVVPDAYTIGGRAASDSTEWFNGRGRCVRQWATVLTPTELAAERDSLTAVKAGAYSDHPVATGTDLSDASGNGRTLTAGSVAGTTEADPPIGTTLTDTPGTARVAAPLETAAASVLHADTPGVARVANRMETPALGITSADAPGTAQIAAVAETAAIGVVVGDAVSAARVGAPSETSAVGVAVSDEPSGVRGAVTEDLAAIGVVLADQSGSVRTAATADVAAVGRIVGDEPATARVGNPVESVFSGQLLADPVVGTARVGDPTEQVVSSLVLLDVIGHATVAATVDAAAATLLLVDGPATARIGSLLEMFTIPSLVLPDIPGTARIAVPDMVSSGGTPIGPRNITVSARVLPGRAAARVLPSRWRALEV